MGINNFLIDGVSCAGKTTVCDELQRRGWHAVHGDRELAYWGHPDTGNSIEDATDGHRAWMWNLGKVKALVADKTHAATFLCGGSRNSGDFIGLMDGVFVLQIDLETLDRRLAARPDDAWSGSASAARALARRQQLTGAGLPAHAVAIDARAPVASVVDSILERAQALASSQSTR